MIERIKITPKKNEIKEKRRRRRRKRRRKRKKKEEELADGKSKGNCAIVGVFKRLPDSARRIETSGSD